MQGRLRLATLATAISLAGAPLFVVAAVLIPVIRRWWRCRSRWIWCSRLPAANAALFAVMLRGAPEEMRGRIVNTVLMAATGLAALAPLVAGARPARVGFVGGGRVRRDDGPGRRVVPGPAGVAGGGARAGARDGKPGGRAVGLTPVFALSLLRCTGWWVVALISLQLPVGALSDRLDRRLTMIVCDVMRAVLLVALGVLIAVHLASWPVVLVISVIEGSASAIFNRPPPPRCPGSCRTGSSRRRGRRPRPGRGPVAVAIAVVVEEAEPDPAVRNRAAPEPGIHGARLLSQQQRRRPALSGRRSSAISRTVPGMAIARYPSFVIDSGDPHALATFYGALLDWKVELSENWADIRGGDELCISFQRVDGYTPPNWPTQALPQQMHLDVMVEDLDAGEAAVLELGATKHEYQPGTTFRVFLDPAGHPFCLCVA